MSLNIALWFAVFIAGVGGIFLAHWIISVTKAFWLLRLYAFLLRKLIYPLLIHRRYWSGVTRFQAILLGVYFVINGFCMGSGIHTTSDLISRSGVMASVNLIPLFFGGRTSMFSRVLGLSLHSYYLAHHWIGRVAVVQGLLHVALVIKSGQPWTFDSLYISGISSVSALSLIFLVSLYFVRRFMYEFFLKSHFFLAMVAVAALVKHLLPSGIYRAALPITALSLWVLNMVLRLGRMIYKNLGGPRDAGGATIEHFYSGGEDPVVSAMRVSVSLKRGTKVRPGEYYYLYFRDRGLRCWQSHPFVATWWDDSINAQSLDFLVEPRTGVTADLIQRNRIREVILDGPYGKNLSLEDCETVILIARGIGIAGVLPYVRHMIYRRSSTSKDLEDYRRGLITRKIDLYWEMDDNCQQDWLQEWILELKKRDAEKLILTFTCFYPSKKNKPPPIAQDPKNPDLYWKFIYQKKALPIIKDLMLERISRSPGKTKVVVCGMASFSNIIRNFTLDAMDSYDDIEFAEVEYQPQGVWRGYPGIRSLVHKETDFEMEIFDKKQRRQQLRKPRAGRTHPYKPASGLGKRMETLKEVDEGSSSISNEVSGREIV